MTALLFFFLENMALIIALMYLGLKTKETLFLDWTNPVRQRWAISIFIGFLTFSIMYNPFMYEGMRLDLREVPLFFISYVGGWQAGLLSAVLPAFYRGYMGGPTMVIGIIQSILLPVLIGGLFHDRKPANQFFVILNIKRMMGAFVVFEAIKSVWMYAATPATTVVIFGMVFFATIAVLAMAIIVNGENRNLVLRKELEFYSNQDPMTHLPNIRFFKNHVGKLIDKGTPMAIIMLDVDYFKVYNDTHGHQKGDVILRSIAQILKDSTRKEDLVARYGGEEFIICLNNPNNTQEATLMVERIRQNVEAYKFEGEANQPEGTLTVSIGISCPQIQKSLEDMIEEADQALYQSKREGRNRVTVYIATA